VALISGSRHCWAAIRAASSAHQLLALELEVLLLETGQPGIDDQAVLQESTQVVLKAGQ